MSQANIELYEELVVELENTANALLSEVEAYRNGDFKNKASSARIRKSTLELTAVGKVFRKESVAFHK